jgi:hypothetical protein
MAIIVGGGPSAPSDLKKIPNLQNALIISANHHAFKLDLKPEYIWCKDHLRIYPGYLDRGRKREYMERELRRYKVPIVGPNFWCDYRAYEWTLTQFNSGQQAIAFAVLLGCAPIVPIGMDCFTGDTYFHDKNAPNISKGRRPGYWVSRLQKLRAALPDSAVRGTSGLMLDTFGAYRPDRHPPPGPLPPLLQKYTNMETLWVRTRREFQDSRDRFAIIPAGYTMPSPKVEADKLCKTGIAERVQLFHA